MLNGLTAFLQQPARLVRAGLWMFFAGAAALFFALLAQAGAAAPAPLAERFPGLPTWFVPETASGYTAAFALVCWGVWAMGAGLQKARGARD